jgi:hypothetical protein
MVSMTNIARPPWHYRAVSLTHHSKAASHCRKTGAFALAPQRFGLLGSSSGLLNRSATEERTHFARNGNGRSNDTIIHARVTAGTNWVMQAENDLNFASDLDHPRSHYRPNNWAFNCRAYFFPRWHILQSQTFPPAA